MGPGGKLAILLLIIFVVTITVAWVGYKQLNRFADLMQSVRNRAGGLSRMGAAGRRLPRGQGEQIV